ncbi:GNAT family N-acetyltransferase [Furfurilactobacillus siliginis]|uniref:N-acetyltransferase GCN5 n=1 Tax=Furfurilactobacillus siliginis TaxID=348151 RepID=A0A0R2L5E2_9LACO|nr:GNAT family protein [Furfurilactobacillus siliginis]KRN96985.1 N-acetyltransferase GCN5 [Furfurilactobacillus siliginis]GEK27744.1 ribosomal protein acetylating enzyme [Furfurilactobacillus siliginis]
MFTHQLDEHLALKLISEEDAEPILACVERDRAQLAQWLPWATDMQTIADEESFITYARHQFADGTMLPLTIVLDGIPVGAIDLHNIDTKQQRAEIGYWLSSAVQGQGIMTRAVDRLMTIGFDELNLHKLILEVDVDNSASQAVAKRLHMHQEGTLRDQLLINGEFHNAHLFSTLETEWEATN